MPFEHELTWISHAKRWRKRYQGKTYYLKSKVGGKRDRSGYLAALEEWERLLDFLDGFRTMFFSGVYVSEEQGLDFGQQIPLTRLCS